MGARGRRTGTKRRADEETQPEDDRFDWLTRRVQVTLAIVGTLVAIATGMVALAGKVAPGHSSVAEASLPQYRQSVGSVCAAINDHDRDHVRTNAVLRRQVKKARTPIAARDAILASVERVQRDSEHDLALLAGLDAPSALRGTVAATARRWRETLSRLAEYARRLDVAEDDRGVWAAVQYNARIGTRVDRDVTAQRWGLNRLGGGQCQLDPRRVTRAIRLTWKKGGDAGGRSPDVKTRSPLIGRTERRGAAPKASGTQQALVPQRAVASGPGPSPDVRPKTYSPDVRSDPGAAPGG